MNENEIFELLSDKNKSVANWDSLLIYFAQRFNNNDLNGLYNLVLLAKKKAEESADFTILDLIYFDFFLASILHREFVGWRGVKHLEDAKEKLDKIDLKDIGDKEKNEIAKFYYDLGKHYEQIELLKPAIETYLNSSNIYYDLDKKEDAQYIDSKIIECNYRLYSRDCHLLTKEIIIKKYGRKSYLLRVLEIVKQEKYNSVEQSKEYLNVINKVNEELVRMGVYSNDLNYKKEKQRLLKERGIDWQY